MPKFLNETSIPHLCGGSEAPNLAIASGIAGTGAEGVADGTDEAGVIVLITGSAPSTGGNIFTLEFSVPYSFVGDSPFVVIAPVNVAAAALTPNQMIFADLGSSGNEYIQFTAGSEALEPSTQYRWVYHVIGRRA
ncbi:MAG: hypothetical protein WBV94_09780 [Blastocatellia bacterium]